MDVVVDVVDFFFVSDCDGSMIKYFEFCDWMSGMNSVYMVFKGVNM